MEDEIPGEERVVEDDVLLFQCPLEENRDLTP
jgi:hypothetical protein